MLSVFASLAAALAPNAADLSILRCVLSHALAIVSYPFRRASAISAEYRALNEAIESRRAAALAYSVPSGLATTDELIAASCVAPAPVVAEAASLVLAVGTEAPAAAPRRFPLPVLEAPAPLSYPSLVLDVFADRLPVLVQDVRESADGATWDYGTIDPAAAVAETALEATPCAADVVATPRRRKGKASEVVVSAAANAPVSSRRIGRYRVVGSGAVGIAYNGSSERLARETFGRLADSGEVIHLYKGSDLIERN